MTLNSSKCLQPKDLRVYEFEEWINKSVPRVTIKPNSEEACDAKQ